MSLSKVKSLKDDVKRDSFDDRICDDLSEVILQFLPIRDKFRLECVSKQFQRTVYERHHRLIVKSIVTSKPSVNQNSSLDLSNFKTNNLVFEKCLKKLPNITYIQQNTCYPIDDSFIDFIIKFCPNLVSIDSNLKTTSETTLKLLTEKFGKQLVSISPKSEDIQMINSFINLKELKLITLNANPMFDSLWKLNLNHLKKLTINLSLFPSNGFETFAENHKSITHLFLNYVENSELEVVFKCLSHLKDLVYLRLHSLGTDCDLLAKQFKQISNNCLNIKYFRLHLECIEVNDNKLDITLLLSELNKFKHLKRLSLSMGFWPGMQVHSDNNSFKGFNNLTHLRLEFPYWHTIDEQILNDIDKHLPKLQSLVIRKQLNATQRTADTLSRLSRLETLDFDVTDESIAGIIRKQVITNCKKIKSIEMSGEWIERDYQLYISDDYSSDKYSLNYFIQSDIKFDEQ